MFQSIFVVEDDMKMAKVVKAYLESAGFSVKYFEKGKDAVEAARKAVPLLLILDLMLPDTTGEEVFMEMKECGDFPVIILTSRSTEEERLAGFALGADDYVVKPFSPRELVYRVKSVLKRAEKKDLVSAELISFNDGFLVLDGQRYEVKRQGHTVNLTPTEFKLLYTLASHSGKTFTRKELVEEALGYQFDGYERSIDAHIRHIRQKIEDDPSEPQLILTVYGVGYRFSGKRDA
ncbi:MAG: response regulator transcription factor [Nitrospirae bacterium]|nr:response regulator transcription factor [Nitrospirota bacterium]MCL5236218.1 response regulator transcription factor [Nitrospirota bacterium]